MYMEFDRNEFRNDFVRNLKYLKQMVRDTVSITFFEFSSNDVR